MYACMYIIYVCAYKHTYNLSPYINTCIYIYTHAKIHVSIFSLSTFFYLSIYLSIIYPYIHICTYTHMYPYTHLHG